MTLKSALAGLALALMCGAQAAVTPAERADIDRAESYLNAVTTLKAHILQIAPDGSASEGTLSLSRPGHLRLDYDPPSQIMLIANTDFLIYRDNELDNTSYVPVDNTPAAVLIRPQIKLDGEGLAVTKVARKPGVVEITVVQAADPKQGRITLVFSEQPYQLRQWQVVDAQGQTTSVSLYDPHRDAKFAKDFFDFREPKKDDWWVNKR